MSQGPGGARNTAWGWRGAAPLACLLVITIFGAVIRLLGVDYGLPYHHHWDEGWIADSVAGMLRRGDDRPASYQYGAPLMRLTELAYLWKRRSFHVPTTLTPADAQVELYVCARVTVALISSTGVVATYVAARRACRQCVRPWLAALSASLLYASSSELVMHSRYGVTDACLVAWTAWTLAFTAIYLDTRRLGWGVVSIVAAGTTCAFKAPGVMTTLLPVFAALFLWRDTRRADARAAGHHLALVAAAVPVVAACYVLLNPHVLDRTGQAVGDFIGRYKQTRDGGISSVYIRRPGLDHLLSAVWAILTAFPSRDRSISIAVSGLCIFGFVDAFRRRLPSVLIAAAYAGCLVLSVALPNRTFLFRNYIVVVPSLSMGFGCGVAALDATLRSASPRPPWLRRAGIAGGCVLLAVALVAVPLRDAVLAWRMRGDPRERAVEWIASMTGGRPVSVGVTPSVFGESALGGYPDLRALFEQETRRSYTELQTCPDPRLGPEFVVVASHRDTHAVAVHDPWEERWSFRECPGYHREMAFGPNPYVVNLDAYPTWPGRVSAIVLRRADEVASCTRRSTNARTRGGK